MYVLIVPKTCNGCPSAVNKCEGWLLWLSKNKRNFFAVCSLIHETLAPVSINAVKICLRMRTVNLLLL